MRQLAIAVLVLGQLASAPAVSRAVEMESCTWSVGELWRGDDNLFGALTCTSDPTKAYLGIGCWFGGAILVRYDLAKGVSWRDGEDYPVEFVTEKGSRVILMDANEMDGTHEAELDANDELFELLSASEMLTIRDPARAYPVRSLSLEGSRLAIGTVLARCARGTT